MKGLTQDFDEDIDVSYQSQADHKQAALLKYNLTSRCSPVQHIFLDSPRNLSSAFHHVLCLASKDLVSMTVIGNEHPDDGIRNFDAVVGALGENYPLTLESLMIYNPQSVHGYRCGTYRPEELHNFERLKQFSIGISDVILDALYESDDAAGLSGIAFVRWLEEAQIFPSSTELLVLWADVDLEELFDAYTTDETLDHMDILDDALVAVINQKYEYYEKLGTIYVGTIETATERQRQSLCFQKSIAAGRRVGVHVQTLTNRNDGNHWRNLPVAPDKFDLQTGSFGKRPCTWKISPKTGKWEDPDCDGCGTCEDCLRVYPEHLWKRLPTDR